MCGKSKGIIQKICLKLMEDCSLKKNATICRRQLLPFGMIFFQVLLVLVLPGIKTTFHSPICIEMYLKVRSLQKSPGYGLQLIESEWNLGPLHVRHDYNMTWNLFFSQLVQGLISRTESGRQGTKR